MLYNQPYGGATNAPYINGDPSIGLQGSIPPAASIEYPQREIVNTITDAGLTPTNADLHQLAKAIQSGKLYYGTDIGTANAVSIICSPPVLALTLGMCFIVKVAADNLAPGPTTLTVNGIGAIQVIHATDKSQLIPLDITTGSMQCFAYDGTKFQLAWVQRPPTTAMTYLQAPLNLFVNGSTGSDANDGLSATVTGGHGPFATIQKAADTTALFNLNGFNINVAVANGTYTQVNLPNTSGSGSVIYTGNTGSPASCAITKVNGSTVKMISGGSYTFNGFATNASGSVAGDGICGFVISRGTMTLGNINFNGAVGAHIQVTNGGLVTNAALGSVWNVNSGCAGNAFIGGAFISCFSLGNAQSNSSGGPAIVGAGGLTFNIGFIDASFLSVFLLTYQSISGFATIAAFRYNVTSNSIVTSGAGGPTYWPGSATGNASTGGQYV